MKGYLTELLADVQPVAAIFDGENYIKEENGYAVGEGAGWAFAFVDKRYLQRLRYGADELPQLCRFVSEWQIYSVCREPIKAKKVNQI